MTALTPLAEQILLALAKGEDHPKVDRHLIEGASDEQKDDALVELVAAGFIEPEVLH